ncbi:MAG: regulatory protein RecX [Spirochaetes bacterium]|nr:regulatory protein RecX [Spirochaetota bacterium]
MIPSQLHPADPREALLRLAAGCVDLEVDDQLFILLVKVDEEERALLKAVELCARAEQHRAGLELKLKAKGFGKAASTRTLDRLEAEDVLNDARYAAAWARTQLRRKPMGPALLRAELRAKGLGAEAAGRAVEDISFGEILPRAAKREMDRGLLDRDDLRAALRRQGFSYEALSEFFDGTF